MTDKVAIRSMQHKANEMFSIDSFEEELREEYGKIFNNIVEIKAAKKRSSGKKTDPCLLQTSCVEGRLKTDPQASRKQKTASEGRNMKKNLVNGAGGSISAKNNEKRKKDKAFQKDTTDKSLVYEKVAMDLEAVFNKQMTADFNTVRSRNSCGDEKSSNSGLHVSSQSFTGNTTVDDTQIRYKTVHTRNDTLYIWTASV